MAELENDIHIRIPRGEGVHPIYHNYLTINRFNTINLDQRNLLEKLLINFNDSFFKEFINFFNSFDIPFYNTEIDNLMTAQSRPFDGLNIDKFTIKIVLSGGKANTFHLPFSYYNSNVFKSLEQDPRTNSDSFDYDIHLIIFNKETNKPISNDEKAAIINEIAEINFNNRLDIFFGQLPYTTSNGLFTLQDVLNNFFGRTLLVGGNKNRGQLAMSYLNNIFTIFNNHPLNKFNNHPIFTIDPLDLNSQFRLYFGRLSNVKRIGLQISYKMHTYSDNQQFTNLLFPLADIEWDYKFAMMSNIWKFGLVTNNDFNYQREIPPEFPEREKLIENLRNAEQYDEYTVGVKDPINIFINDAMPLLRVENMLVIPFDISLLNTVVFSFKKQYVEVKRQRNIVKYNKYVDKLVESENECSPALNLNPRYFDRKNGDWLYNTEPAINLSGRFNPRESNIYLRFMIKFRTNAVVNNILKSRFNESIYAHLGSHQDLNKIGIDYILKNALADVESTNYFINQYQEIFRKIILSDTLRNQEKTDDYLRNYNLLEQILDTHRKIKEYNFSPEENLTLEYWKEDEFRNLNLYLTFESEPNADLEFHKQNLENIFLKPEYRELDLTVARDVPPNPTLDLLEEPSIKNILNLVFPDANKNDFLLTYACTRYFNITNMTLLDFNNLEFFPGAYYKLPTYTSSYWTPYMNWKDFQNIEDTNYIFQYIIHSRQESPTKYIFTGDDSKEILLNRNLTFLVLKIEVKNILIEETPGETKDGTAGGETKGGIGDGETKGGDADRETRTTELPVPVDTILPNQKIRNKNVITVLVLNREEIEILNTTPNQYMELRQLDYLLDEAALINRIDIVSPTLDSVAETGDDLIGGSKDLYIKTSQKKISKLDGILLLNHFNQNYKKK